MNGCRTNRLRNVSRKWDSLLGFEKPAATFPKQLFDRRHAQYISTYFTAPRPNPAIHTIDRIDDFGPLRFTWKTQSLRKVIGANIKIVDSLDAKNLVQIFQDATVFE